MTDRLTVSTGPTHRVPTITSLRLTVAGFWAMLVARVWDTAVTVPMLAAHPAGESNPVAVAIAAEVGVWGWAGLSLLAVPLVVVLVEGGVLASRRLPYHREALVPWVKLWAYGPVTLISLASALRNTHLLAELLGDLVAVGVLG